MKRPLVSLVFFAITCHGHAQEPELPTLTAAVTSDVGRKRKKTTFKWGYVEPEWYGRIKAEAKVDPSIKRLKRCLKRNPNGPMGPPKTGFRCGTGRKTCFFGTQNCPGIGAHPELRCDCDGKFGSGRWACASEVCPKESAKERSADERPPGKSLGKGPAADERPPGKSLGKGLAADERPLGKSLAQDDSGKLVGGCPPDNKGFEFFNDKKCPKTALKRGKCTEAQIGLTCKYGRADCCGNCDFSEQWTCDAETGWLGFANAPCAGVRCAAPGSCLVPDNCPALEERTTASCSCENTVCNYKIPHPPNAVCTGDTLSCTCDTVSGKFVCKGALECVSADPPCIDQCPANYEDAETATCECGTTCEYAYIDNNLCTINKECTCNEDEGTYECKTVAQSCEIPGSNSNLKCPDPIGFGICVESCTSDGDCGKGQLCCSNGCGHVCMAGVETGGTEERCPPKGLGFEYFNDPLCPKTADIGESCSEAQRGLKCEYDRQNCCGNCDPGTKIFCGDNNEWFGYSMAQCILPQCPILEKITSAKCGCEGHSCVYQVPPPPDQNCKTSQSTCTCNADGSYDCVMKTDCVPKQVQCEDLCPSLDQRNTAECACGSTCKYDYPDPTDPNCFVHEECTCSNDDGSPTGTYNCRGQVACRETPPEVCQDLCPPFGEHLTASCGCEATFCAYEVPTPPDAFCYETSTTCHCNLETGKYLCLSAMMCEPEPIMMAGRPYIDASGRSLLADKGNKGLDQASSWSSPYETAATLVERPSLTDSELTKEEQRADASEEWSNRALAEHASVASFASVTLSLLTNGAPPDLIRDSLLAALDEVGHARAAFDAASLLAGKRVEPGLLPPSSHHYEHNVAKLALGTAKEGCVEETVSALQEASKLEASANSAAVGSKVGNETHAFLMERVAIIAAEETRHSILAWRTVHWACTVDASAREAVRSFFLNDVHGKGRDKWSTEIQVGWKRIHESLVPLVTLEEDAVIPALECATLTEAREVSGRETTHTERLVQDIIDGVVCAISDSTMTSETVSESNAHIGGLKEECMASSERGPVNEISY